MFILQNINLELKSALRTKYLFHQTLLYPPIHISLDIPDLIGLNADEPEYQRACGMVVFCWAEPSILARSSISPIPNRSLPPRGINPGNRERLGLKTRSTHLRLKIATSSSLHLIPKTANTFEEISYVVLGTWFCIFPGHIWLTGIFYFICTNWGLNSRRKYLTSIEQQFTFTF